MAFALVSISLGITSTLPAQRVGDDCGAELEATTRDAARAFQRTLRAELDAALGAVGVLRDALQRDEAAPAHALTLFDALAAFNGSVRQAWLAAVDATAASASQLVHACATPHHDFLYGGGGALDELLSTLEALYERARDRLRSELAVLGPLSEEASSLRVTARFAGPLVPGEIERFFDDGVVAGSAALLPVIDVALGVTVPDAGASASRILHVSGTSYAAEVELGAAFGSASAVPDETQRFQVVFDLGDTLPAGGIVLVTAFAGAPAQLGDALAIGLF